MRITRGKKRKENKERRNMEGKKEVEETGK